MDGHGTGFLHLTFTSALSERCTIAVLEHRRATLRQRVSLQEWQAREDLAACYRLCVHYRMTDMIYNHISLKIPGSDDHFLINAFGLLYEQVRAGDQREYSWSGSVRLSN
jgi:hypothetical protein